MNGNMGRPKRKDPDEVQVDYFLGYHDLLTPYKKMRLDSGLPTIFEDQPDFGVPCDIPAETPELQQLHSVSHPTEPLAVVTQTTPVAQTEDKAIVLYKPVNPPLFPGGPPAGSLDLPIKINSNFLPTQKAAWQDGLLNVQDLLLISRPKDTAHGHTNFKISPGQPVDNRLAVVPWVQSHLSISSNGLSSQEGPDRANISVEIEQMPADGDAAVPMEEDQFVTEQQPPNVCMLNSSIATNQMEPRVQLQQPVMSWLPFNTQVM